jgi:hypothetical protein
MRLLEGSAPPSRRRTGDPVAIGRKIVAVVTMKALLTALAIAACHVLVAVLVARVDDGATAAFLWRLYLAVGNAVLVIAVPRWRRCVQRTAIAR